MNKLLLICAIMSRDVLAMCYLAIVNVYFLTVQCSTFQPLPNTRGRLYYSYFSITGFAVGQMDKRFQNFKQSG